MWGMIFAMAALVFMIRSAPVCFPQLHNVLKHPRVNRVLDYAICLITGELIYSLAFADFTANHGPYAREVMLMINSSTLVIAMLITWRVQSFTKSFVISLTAFFLLYFWFA